MVKNKNIVVDDILVLVVDYISLLLDIQFDSMKKVLIVDVVADNMNFVFLINYNDDADYYLN